MQCCGDLRRAIERRRLRVFASLFGVVYVDRAGPGCATVLAIGIAVVAPVATRRPVGGLSAAAARRRTAAAAPLPYMILLFVYDFAFVINEYRLLCQRVFVG